MRRFISFVAMLASGMFTLAVLLFTIPLLAILGRRDTKLLDQEVDPIQKPKDDFK